MSVNKKSVFEKIQDRKNAGKVTGKKKVAQEVEAKKPQQEEAANRMLIANVNAYLLADEQEKNAKQLKDKLKEKIFKKLDEDGEVSGKGHRVLETDLYTITKERRATFKIAEEAANTFADKGLLDHIDVSFTVSGKYKKAVEAAIINVLGGAEIYREEVKLTPEEVERALLNGNITQDEFKELCEEKESFSLKVKKK